MTVVVGMGYVGLPLALCIIKKAGKEVVGIDINEEQLQKIRNGQSPISDISDSELKEVVENQKLKVTNHYRVIKDASEVVICVPTPLNHYKEPDLSCIKSAVASILPYIERGTFISLESTTYPRTTEELITKKIEEEKGWVVGTDFFVCYSPERVDPNNQMYRVENTPKVIGGSTKACLERGIAFYTQFLPEIVPVSSTEVAEMSKLLENTFRHVNIALMNEMTQLCERMHINIWEAIKGASSKPFGFMPFYPGPGVGGHCIPLDPRYLSWKAREHDFYSRFIELASDVNSNMPYYVCSQIDQIMAHKRNHGRILLLGMSYKENISDLRESPSLAIYDILLEKGYKVDFYDSFVTSFKKNEQIIKSIDSLDTVPTYDLVVILTPHTTLDYDAIAKRAQLVYDTRHVAHGEHVITMGAGK